MTVGGSGDDPPRKVTYPHLDILRAICVICVTVGHEFPNLEKEAARDGPGGLLGMHWITQYLFLISGSCFAIGLRPLSGYALRVLACLAVGMAFNAAALQVKHKLELSAAVLNPLLHQLWYLVVLLAAAGATEPLKAALADRERLLGLTILCAALVLALGTAARSADLDGVCARLTGDPVRCAAYVGPEAALIGGALHAAGAWALAALLALASRWAPKAGTALTCLLPVYCYIPVLLSYGEGGVPRWEQYLMHSQLFLSGFVVVHFPLSCADHLLRRCWIAVPLIAYAVEPRVTMLNTLSETPRGLAWHGRARWAAVTVAFVVLYLLLWAPPGCDSGRHIPPMPWLVHWSLWMYLTHFAFQLTLGTMTQWCLHAVALLVLFFAHSSQSLESRFAKIRSAPGYGAVEAGVALKEQGEGWRSQEEPAAPAEEPTAPAAALRTQGEEVCHV